MRLIQARIVHVSTEFSGTCLTRMRARERVCAWGAQETRLHVCAVRALLSMSDSCLYWYESMRANRCAML